MGIQGLLKVFNSIQTDRHISHYQNQTVGVDTYCWIHKAIYFKAKSMLLTSDHSVFIPFVLSQIESLLQYKIKVVMIFDGGKLLSKEGEEASRETNRQLKYAKALELLKAGDHEAAYRKYSESVDVSPDLAYLLLKVIRAKYGITCIVSPYEADAQLAYLSRIGFVDAILTEDSDLLCFGAKKILYKMNRQLNVKEIELKNWQNCSELDFKNWEFDLFLSLCIISGCDYLPSIKGIGFKTAYKALKETRSVEILFRKWKMDPKIEINNEYEEKFYKAFLTFKFQRVFCPVSRKLSHVNEFNLEKFEKILKESFNINTLAKNFQDPNLLSPIVIKKLKDFTEIDDGLEFLGKQMTDSIARDIADGLLNPISLKPYEAVAKVDFSIKSSQNSEKSKQKHKPSPKNLIKSQNITKFTAITDLSKIQLKQTKLNFFDSCNKFNQNSHEINQSPSSIKEKFSKEILAKQSEILDTSKIGFSRNHLQNEKKSFEIKKSFEPLQFNAFSDNIRKRALENASRLKPQAKKTPTTQKYKGNDLILTEKENMPSDNNNKKNDNISPFLKKPFQTDISTYFKSQKDKPLAVDFNESEFSLNSNKRNNFKEKKANLILKTPECIDKEFVKFVFKKNPLKRSLRPENCFLDMPNKKTFNGVEEYSEKPKVWEIIKDLSLNQVDAETIIREFKEGEKAVFKEKKHNVTSKGFLGICAEIFKPIFN